jgi:hypothetical protein
VKRKLTCPLFRRPDSDALLQWRRRARQSADLKAEQPLADEGLGCAIAECVETQKDEIHELNSAE